MGSPYTITEVVDIAASSVVNNIIDGVEGSIVPEDGYIELAANGETGDVTMQVTVGSEQAMPEGRVNVEGTVGVLPSIRDDMILQTFARAGDQITIRGRNADAGAARELRVVLKITPLDDLALINAMQSLGAGAGAA